MMKDIHLEFGNYLVIGYSLLDIGYSTFYWIKKILDAV